MGAMDTIIRVDAGAMRLASITKQKDAEAGTPIAFGLKSVKLGEDEEGEPVLSAVVAYLKASTCVKLSKAAEGVLQALKDLIGSSERSTVLEGDWRTAWSKEQPDSMTADAQRVAWNRNRTKLLQLGIVRQAAGEWSLAPAADDAPVMDFGFAAGSGR